jgi:hypothetical protein
MKGRKVSKQLTDSKNEGMQLERSAPSSTPYVGKGGHTGGYHDTPPPHPPAVPQGTTGQAAGL